MITFIRRTGSELRGLKSFGSALIDSFQLPQPFPDYICRVNHWRGVIYWHCWHFRGTPPPPAHHHHLPVHPSLPLIPSINASRQAPGYRSPSSSTLHSCTPTSRHPSVPLHHSQLKGTGWVALICSYEYASASYPYAKQQVKRLSGLHALHRNDFVFGVWLWRGLDGKYLCSSV